jgi:copper(I)-binding protein
MRMPLPWLRFPVAGPAFRRRCAWLLALWIVAAPAATAQAAEAKLTVSGPWMRAIMPSRPAAGYFTLSNGGDADGLLTAADSPACGMIMLHQSVQENGQDKMRMVESVAVPAHGEVAFAPGGYHLMCMSPSADVTAGGEVPVTLHFDDGSAITASFPVRGATGN